MTAGQGVGSTGVATGAPATPYGVSSAKEAILARIRASLRDVPAVPADEDTPVPWSYGRRTRPDLTDAGVVDLFVERVEDYKATVVRAGAAEVPAAIAAALRSRGVRSVVVPEGLDHAWIEALAEFDVRRDAPPLSRARLDETDAVVTAARVCAAESGTIMLDHAPDQGRRALTLVPDLHVCVVGVDQVVTDVPEAMARLAPSVREQAKPVTWISGGSATSDIELSRVEGVHGPRTLVVILRTD